MYSKNKAPHTSTLVSWLWTYFECDIDATYKLPVPFLRRRLYSKDRIKTKY